MEEVSFQDWPGQPVDLNNTGTNPWMPAYGLQPPISALLDKEDFAGNPDAEYFFHGTSGQFMYLETIQEETSDDLRSDSGSRTSPVGWLATDSESGSVICIQDDADCDSDRELACPPKRRKQDLFLSFACEEYEEPTSLSRSSSLLQFETLEKQFQQESQSPSIFSQFSFDSLELGKKQYCLEDSSPEYEGDFFKNVVNSKQSSSRDSLLYNASTRYSGSESSDSDTIFDTSRSCDNLKTWRSFDSLPLTNGHCSAGKRFSSENLSEDSGYGDQMLYGKAGNLSNSAGNLADKRKNMTGRIGDMVKSRGKKNSYVGFNAYDCDVFQNFHGNFGVSYQDLSIFERYDPFSEPLSKSSPLTDVFLRRKQARQLLNADFTLSDHRPVTNSSKVNLDVVSAVSPCSNYNIDTVIHASSAPNLCQNELTKLEPVVDIFSLPKDLNFLGSISRRRLSTKSVAENNWNLADIWEKDVKDSEFSSDRIKVSEDSNVPEEEMANYRREGSYSEAMRNRVDLSDDENSLVFKKKLPKSPIVDFDRRVLKAISEQSLQSLMGSTISLRGSQARLDNEEYAPATKLGNYNVAKSTPDLNRFEPARKRDKTALFEDRERGRSNLDIRTTSRLEEERNKNILLDTSNDETEVVMRRKGSIIKSSTSTSGMSDIDDKTLRNSVKSFTGSTGSKGVTFAPVVAEVNWGDDASVSTATPDRESSYSLDSSSPEPVRSPPPQKLVKPRARYPRPQSRRSVSQPDLSDTDGVMYKREFIDHLNKFRDDDVEMSKSQPDMSKLKRRGSQMVKKDKDGCTIKAYVDADGIQYKHTQLDLKTLSQNSLNDDNSTTDNTAKLLNSSGAADSKNSLLQSSSGSGKHPYHHHYYGHEPRPAATAQHQQQTNVERQRQSNVAKQPNVVGRMDGEGDAMPRSSTRDAKSSTKNNRSGLGGFLQRLASFRLGVKKGQEKVKRKAQTQGTTAVHSRPITNQNTTKPEYIYIPLKGPENNNVPTNQAPLMAKPPLPKQPPPRVVHASVKKHPSQGAQAPDYGATGDDRRRRRTIDSGSVATSGGDLGRRTRGNASMEGPMGLIETDLDTEVTVITSGANAKARSLLDLGQEPRLQVPQKAEGQQGHSGRPHKSMEFLLDKQNLKVVEPPENELQKTERVMSEHELRVQRSLQKLTIPDWYKHSQVPGQGFLLNKKNASRDTRWTGTGTGSKTTSLSSLGSGTQSPIVLSPTPCNQPFVRWSTSKLNSTASSPCQSTRSSFNQGRQPVNGSISPSSARSSFSYRQPYMGWRSQERLNRPRTPAERLACSLLAQQVHNSTQENPEIQTSIKEVTSAIVHYVSGMKPPGPDHMDNHSQRSSSVSPRGSSQKLCWLESSFVGTKPLDSPETPVTCSESPVPPPGLRLDLQNYSSNDLATLSGGDTKVRPSPSSTTLEDVLDSLLGLPSSGRAPSPCLQGRRHVDGIS
ncbi:uncharacterized protein LOC115881940 isoform X3 [Sitophilus oryzae]|uniref:Uncharacterized protein LOC115881940 isoform X3 n=2 Tax=Sitophilus oryzae TaxID=7048 RepID=A0A6J2XXX8_SITOR|nr:uncharacterized protein LOC115881940 isoform X3 [Sitophilus oryzae]